VDRKNHVNSEKAVERFDTIVIGAGQAGLAVGYYLSQQGHDFVVLDAHQRVGDAWRERWDSLRLFMPAEYSSLPGMAFPAPAGHFPLKDEAANYLEKYAKSLVSPYG
jgi:putative flavoprotein involved in K+ transport